MIEPSVRYRRLHRWRMMGIDVPVTVCARVLPGLLRSRRSFARVHQVPQLLAWLEEGNPFGWNSYCGSGLRIPSGARVALPRAEAPKATDLHLIVGFQCTDNGFEQRVDNYLTVTAGEIAECSHLVD